MKRTLLKILLGVAYSTWTLAGVILPSVIGNRVLAPVLDVWGELAGYNLTVFFIIASLCFYIIMHKHIDFSPVFFISALIWGSIAFASIYFFLVPILNFTESLFVYGQWFYFSLAYIIDLIRYSISKIRREKKAKKIPEAAESK